MIIDRQLYDSIPEAVLIYAPDGSIIYSNPVATDQYNKGIRYTEINSELQQCRELLKPIALYHTFTDANGSSLYCKVHLRPVTDGVLLMATEMTGCKKQEVIERITNFHKAILDNTTENIVLISCDHKVLCYNKQIQQELFRYFGVNITAGDDYRDFVIDSHQSLYLESFDKALKGEVVSVESETTQGDLSIWFHYRVNPVYASDGSVLGVALTATNIDVRKRKELALLESERTVRAQAETIASRGRYFQSLIETSSDAIVLLNMEGRVTYQTPSTQKILGYSLDDMQTIDGIELIHIDDRIRDGEAFAQLVQEPGQVLKRRHRVKHKEGHYIWISATYRNLLQDPDIHSIVMNYADISDKVAFEGRLEKANRELTVLNNINDVIIRERDERSLYKAICDCITASGGYRLAWICFRPGEDVADKTVRSIEASGEVTYLEDIRIDLNDPELAKGPTGTVLNTGTTVVTNNVTKVASYRPWLLKAQRHGIAASIVLPLNFGNGQVGAINIYSERVDAFDEHEAMVLERVARNISVAVYNLRTEQEKHRTKRLLKERVKELTTIYKLNSILQDEHLPADVIFSNIVNLLPSGWQYPEICVARISFDGKEYLSPGYVPVAIKQVALFALVDGREGMIEVGYTEETQHEYEGPFFKEERDLIDTVAETIQVYFNKAQQHKAIMLSESYLRSSFQYAAIGKAMTSLDGRFFKVNSALCSMVGYTEDELLNMTYRQLTFPEDHDNDTVNVQQILDGSKQYYRVEKRYIHKDGSIIWVNLNTTLIRDQENRPQYFISQIENINERKRAEASLIRSEANLHTIFDSTEVGYLLLDKHYDIVAYNHAFYTGFAAERGLHPKVDANYITLLPDNRRASALSHFDQVMTTQKPIEYEMQFNTSDDSNYYNVCVVPVVNNNECIGICVSAINITVRKRQELERQEMINDLLQKNNDLQQFAYIVSHNIRGPLSTILGLNNIVDETLPLADQQFYFDGIRQSSEKLDMVIRDLNLILQLKRGVAVQKEKVFLKDVLADVLGELLPAGAEHKAIVSTDFSEVTSVNTVGRYLKNVIYNLVSNSIKFARTGVAPEVKISARKAGDMIVISCSDNGLGIDLDKYRSRLFMLYQRFHFHVEGKGFGLFITKTQVEAMNGKIEVESKPGEGSTFYVYLPA